MSLEMTGMQVVILCSVKNGQFQTEIRAEQQLAPYRIWIKTGRAVLPRRPN